MKKEKMMVITGIMSVISFLIFIVKKIADKISYYKNLENCYIRDEGERKVRNKIKLEIRNKPAEELINSYSAYGIRKDIIGAEIYERIQSGSNAN